MADEKLHTILHLSDLHFGDGSSDNRNAGIPRDIGWIKVLEGLLGHHWHALEDLEDFVWRLRNGQADPTLVVSGDLSVCGSQSQFDLAAGFLGQGAASNGLGLDLGFSTWRDSTIPGNHDRWPGIAAILGWPTAAFHALFPGPYPIVRSMGPYDGVTLTYILLDTDGEVGPVSPDRFFARGRFRRQIQALDGMLQTSDPGEIRVLVLHHAILDLAPHATVPHAPFPRRSANAARRGFEIESGSLALLERAVVKHGVRIVMSGHLHVPRLTTLTATWNSTTHDLLDARCGTTTQRDAYPKAAQRWMRPGRKPLEPNSLVLHDLWRRGRKLVWEAQVYRRTPGRGFLAHGSPHAIDLV